MAGENRFKGCFRGFIQHSRSYYAKRVPPGGDAVDEVFFGFYEDGRCVGEVRVEWVRIGRDAPTPRLAAFGDTWPVLGHLPEVLAALPTIDPEISPEGFCALLLSLGFKDMTKTENPDPAPPNFGRFFITGITVRYGYGGSEREALKYGWWASTTWRTADHMTDHSMEGAIETRYAVASLSSAIDYILAVADKFGIECGAPGTDRKLWLMYADDELQATPADWRDTLKAEAGRRGWHVDLA